MSVAGEGRLIVLDGPDGCGKTTQVALLAEALRSRGRAVTTVRDPGGTDLGERIRQLLLSPASSPASPAGRHRDITARAEVLLYMASRAELTQRVILPALRDGQVVVADRFYSASVAYQGVGRGLGIEPVLELARFACAGLEPTLTLILDMDPEEALRRRGMASADRIESRPMAYHRQVRDGFRRLAEAYPRAVKLVPAEGSIQAVRARVWSEVERVL